MVCAAVADAGGRNVNNDVTAQHDNEHRNRRHDVYGRRLTPAPFRQAPVSSDIARRRLADIRRTAHRLLHTVEFSHFNRSAAVLSLPVCQNDRSPHFQFDDRARQTGSTDSMNEQCARALSPMLPARSQLSAGMERRPSLKQHPPPSCQTRRFAPALLAFDASSIATDHTSGEGGAIGHVRPFPVYLLNQLITLELVRTRVMATGSSGNGDCKSKLPAWSSRLTVSAKCLRYTIIYCDVPSTD